ncbi:MAG: DUF2058 family protein [Pseudomonadales bacterium]
MAGSLRDQLIKAGIATNEQARRAERQLKAEKQARSQGGGKTAKGKQPPDDAPNPDALREKARQYNAEKAQRDRELQQAANEKAAAKARRAQIKQLIAQNNQRTQAADDDVPYNFVHGKKVKRIYVTKTHQAQLGAGSLVIVQDDGRYHLVAPDVASRIAALDPRRVLARPATDAPASEDDEYYARFKVPDDLDW